MRSHTRNGFSIVELLTVVAIASLMTVFAAASVRGIGSGAKVSTAGYQVSNIFNLARQNSLTKRTMTAVVVLTDSADTENAYRVFSVFELQNKLDGSSPTTGDWVRVLKWEILPKGVIVDTAPNASSFLTAHSSPPNPSLPTISYAGRSYAPDSGYRYQIFSPSGAIVASQSPCTLKLTAGYLNGSAVSYTSSQGSNYFSFMLNDATGQAKITRP